MMIEKAHQNTPLEQLQTWYGFSEAGQSRRKLCELPRLTKNVIQQLCL